MGEAEGVGLVGDDGVGTRAVGVGGGGRVVDRGDRGLVGGCVVAFVGIRVFGVFVLGEGRVRERAGEEGRGLLPDRTTEYAPLLADPAIPLCVAPCAPSRRAQMR